jgi:hypothetical protein
MQIVEKEQAGNPSGAMLSMFAGLITGVNAVRDRLDSRFKGREASRTLHIRRSGYVGVPRNLCDGDAKIDTTDDADAASEMTASEELRRTE